MRHKKGDGTFIFQLNHKTLKQSTPNFSINKTLIPVSKKPVWVALTHYTSPPIADYVPRRRSRGRVSRPRRRRGGKARRF